MFKKLIAICEEMGWDVIIHTDPGNMVTLSYTVSGRYILSFTVSISSFVDDVVKESVSFSPEAFVREQMAGEEVPSICDLVYEAEKLGACLSNLACALRGRRAMPVNAEKQFTLDTPYGTLWVTSVSNQKNPDLVKVNTSMIMENGPQLLSSVFYDPHDGHMKTVLYGDTSKTYPSSVVFHKKLFDRERVKDMFVRFLKQETYKKDKTECLVNDFEIFKADTPVEVCLKWFDKNMEYFNRFEEYVRSGRYEKAMSKRLSGPLPEADDEDEEDEEDLIEVV